MVEIEQLASRLQSLETSVAKITEFIASKTGADDSQHNENDEEVQNFDDQQPNTGPEVHVQSNSQSQALPQGAATGLPENLQKEFHNIRDTLSRVNLTSGEKLNESPLGIKKPDKQAFTILQKSARYLETAITIV